MLDVVLPATGGAKRVACLSKHLNGKGYGPFVAASKTAANKEVWAASDKQVQMYRDFENKLKSKLASREGSGLTIVRCGTLKGGGPASPDDPIPDDVPTLSEKLYDDLAKDIVNWQLLFDCDTRGVALTPGDSAEGPGLRAVFTACASDACRAIRARPGLPGLVDHSRDDARGKNLASRRRRPRHSSDAEWAAALDSVL